MNKQYIKRAAKTVKSLMSYVALCFNAKGGETVFSLNRDKKAPLIYSKNRDKKRPMSHV